MRLLSAASLIYWVCIMIALLNYGAVDLLTVTLLTFPTFVLLAISAMWFGISGHTKKTLWAAGLVLVLALAWIAFQTMPLPGAAFSTAAWQDVLSFAPDVRAVISLTPGDDQANALRIAVPFGVFMLGLVLFQTDDRAMTALMVLSMSGGAVAFLSICQFLIAPDMLLFDTKVAYRDSLTGFFVNRNTAATYFGLVVLLTAAMADRRARAVDWRNILRAWSAQAGIPMAIRPKLWWASFYVGLLLLSVVALMLTNSRGGIGSAFLGVLVLVVLILLRRPGRSSTNAPIGAPGRNIGRTLISVAVLIGIVLAFVSVGSRVLLRAQIQDAGDDGRFCVLPGIFAAVRDHFPFGTGLSSFIEVFAGYRDPRCGVIAVWDMAHNVYAEGLFTFGIAFVVLAAVVLLWLAVTFVTGIRRRQSVRFAGEVGVASLFLVAAHSAIDFSLQISGFAIFFAALLAPLVTLSLRPPGGGRRIRKG